MIRKYKKLLLASFVCALSLGLAMPAYANDLFKAARKGRLSEVENIVLYSARDVVDSRDGFGRTALMVAARYGELEIVRFLINNGADVNYEDNDGWTALKFAAGEGKLEIVKFLINNGADVNAKDNNGWTALMSAANNGYLKIVKYLVDNGADVNTKDDYGKVLMVGASGRGPFGNEGLVLEVVKYLVELGMDVRAKNTNELSKAFVRALWRGNMRVAQYLVKEGADINILNTVRIKNSEENCGALIWAVCNNKLEIVKNLIDHGANVNTKSSLSRNHTVLTIAIDRDNLEIANLLIERGAKTDLLGAVNNDNFKVVKYLVEHGADVNTKDKNGRTALFIAAESGHLEMVKCLVEHGADIDGGINGGAIMVAACDGHLEIVKYLVEHGANVNVKDSWKERTVLSWVRRKKRSCSDSEKGRYREIIQFLKDNGAIDSSGSSDSSGCVIN